MLDSLFLNAAGVVILTRWVALIMAEKDDKDGDESLELRILVQLRQVLAAVVRDVTPAPGRRNPLSERTIEDVRDAFALIAARERELRGPVGNKDLPVFKDKGTTTHIVNFDSGKDKPN